MHPPQISTFPASQPGSNPPRPASRDDQLMEKARALESSFLSEMLSYGGLDGPDGELGDSGFSGGIGEQQFASFLRQQQADMIVKKGGIGLAETLFHALKKGQADGQ